MTISKGYPFTAQIKERPIPVFPLLGSITIFAGVNSPFFSASSIIVIAILSFTEPAGLYFSNFANINTLGFGLLLLIRTKGVLPINFKIFE